MPSSKPRRKTTSTKPRRRGAESPWAKIKRLLMQRELWGLFVCALSVAALMALLLPEQGKLGEAWSRALRQIMGVGAYVVVLLCVAGAWWSCSGSGSSLRARR